MSRPNRMAQVHTAPPAEDAQPSAPAVRTAPTKVSATLAPAPYFALVDFCASSAKVTGARVTHVDVLRALVAELVDSADLRTRVLARLRK